MTEEEHYLLRTLEACEEEGRVSTDSIERVPREDQLLLQDNGLLELLDCSSDLCLSELGKAALLNLRAEEARRSAVAALTERSDET